jgi:TolB-like protein/Tfp pilus assembly protein PilF
VSTNRSLIDELKRRNVFRVATVYAVASWVTLQLSDILFPAMGLPDEDIRFVIFTLAIFFPAVIAFAWYFEVTPDGLRLSRQVKKGESITRKTARRIDLIIILLLSLALTFFMYEYFTRDAADPAVTSIETNQHQPKLNVVEEPGDTRPSVAVLPFVNMSSDRENEHFSDGLSEELLNVLAQMRGLRVVGRTSSFYYKGKSENLRDIGEALNVNNILEGSVRKSGDTIRITAQLISASDGFHLWSKTFDREVTDVFAIQDEISKEVANAMKLTLLNDGVELPESRLTTNPEAHDLYLRAKEALYQRKEDSIRLAIDLFAQASVLDPEYAPPLLGYADANLILQNNFNSISLLDATENAKAALDKAASLDYQTSDYWATLGLYHHHLSQYEDSHFLQAADAYARALELNENNINAYMWSAALFSEDLDIKNDLEAFRLVEKAVDLDPLNRVANGNYQLHLSDQGRDSEAQENLKRLIKIDPEHNQYIQQLAAIHLMNDRWAEASKLLVLIPRFVDRYSFFSFMILTKINAEDRFEAFFDAVAIDNPLIDAMRATEQGLFATPAELVAEAEILLLQPDLEGQARSIIYRLIEIGRFGLARALIENMAPALKRDINELKYDRFNSLPDYMVCLYFAGEIERSHQIAEMILEQNQNRRRMGPRGKGIDDAISYLTLGDTEKAVGEIELAFDEGWRSYYSYRIDHQPIFKPILHDKSIERVKNDIDQYIQEQRPVVLKNMKDAAVF